MANYTLDYSGAQVSAKLDQLDEMSGIAVQDSPPTQNIKMWLDTSGNPLTLPEVDDAHTNSLDTWSSQKINNEIGTVSGKVDDLADLIGIVVDGDTSSLSASIGQYVILKNSTIMGKTDGLYTAAKAITANTAIDDTYLQGDSQGNPINGGGLNALNTNLLNLLSRKVDKVSHWRIEGFGNKYYFLMTVPKNMFYGSFLVVTQDAYGIYTCSGWNHVSKLVGTGTLSHYTHESGDNCDIQIVFSSQYTHGFVIFGGSLASGNYQIY